MGYAFLTGVRKQTFNENLLINPDFTINQRGEASYTLGSSVTYSYDRWKMLYNAAYSNYTVTKVSNGLSFSMDLTNGGNYFPFAQSIENWEWLKGKIVTVSIKVSSVSGSFRLGIFDGPTATAGGYFSTDGIYKFTTRISADAVRVMFAFGVTGIRTHSCVIEWAKLEYGANATAFCAPDPATEIVRCQRYFYIIKKADNYTEYGMGWTNSLTSAIIGIDVPTMRTTPTISVSANTDFAIRNGPNNINGTSANTPPTLRAYIGKTAFIQFATTLNMLSDYALVSLRSNVVGSWIAFDAEIY